jgi:uncharacterized membrane protein YeaQ/YmgE (transglycosylase-associated protein family)
MNFLSWIIFGAIFGVVSHFIDPVGKRDGLVGSVILGVLGALLGGFIANLIFDVDLSNLTFTSLSIAVIGSLFFLFVQRIFGEKSERRWDNLSHKLILGVFAERDQAEKAIDSLEEAGYSAKDISIVMKDAHEAHDVADSTGATVADSAVSGATTGGVIGGIAGLLVGIGAITIPGVGALLIGGPLAAALGLGGAAATTVSGAVTGALAGGLVGALAGLGVPEEEAKIYEERVKEGAILVAIPLKEEGDNEAQAILESHGADQIRTVSEKA